MRSLTIIAISLAMWCNSASAQVIVYSLTEIGTFGGRTEGSRLNNRGQVTGVSYTVAGVEGNHRAFLYSDGRMQDLGTLGGANSWGFDINDDGQVVGYSTTVDEAATHAFLYSDGAMHDLGTLGGATSGGRGINNSGQVVGFSTAVDNFEHPFLYSNGAMQDLGTLGGIASTGFGINDLGQVTGESLTAGGEGRHAFLYSDGVMHDLGTLGGNISIGYDINDKRQVTGYSSTAVSLYEHAFIYSDGLMEDIGTLGGERSVGLGIDEAGQVTGFSSKVDGDLYAFLYSGGRMRDLNELIDPDDPLAPFVRLNGGLDINDSGTILAAGFNVQAGRDTAYLLTPRLVVRPFNGGGGLIDLRLLSGLVVIALIGRRRSARTSTRQVH